MFKSTTKVKYFALALALLTRTAFAAVDVTVSQAPSTGAVDAQETYVYALTVTNNGSTAAAGVTVTDTVPSGTLFKTAGSSAGWSCPNNSAGGTVCTNTIGALAAGASAVRNFSVNAQYLYPPSSDPGPITNTACASDPADVTPANNCQANSLPTTYTQVSLAQGALVDHDGDGLIGCNDDIHITGLIDAGSLLQNGQQTGLVDDFWVAPQVPDSTNSQGWAFGGGSPVVVSGFTTCNPITIVNGQNTGDNFLHANVNCPALISPNQGRIGTIDFQIHVIGTTATLIVDGIAHTTDGFNLKTNQVVMTVAKPCPPPQPNMALSKTSGPSPIAAGQTLISTLSYSNIGGAGAPGVVLTETVPANTTFTTTGSSAGWSCANGAPAGTTCTIAIGTVAAGGSGSRAFAALVASPIPAGVTTIGNSACASTTGTDPNSANNCSSTSTPVGGPNMVLSKTALPNPVAAGQTLTYTLSYQNIGTLPSNNTTLSETVPANTTFTTTGSSAGWSCANGAPAGTACTLNVGTVVATGSGSKTFAVVVASPIPAGVTSIGNSACARPTPSSEDTNPANDCGSVSTPTAAPNMALTKTASPTPIGAGQTLTYTLAYSNSGTAAATSVVLSETVPANTSFTTTGSSAGWSCANGSPAGTACTLSVGTVAAAGSGSKTFAVVVASPIPAGVTSIGNSACAHPTPASSDSNPANDCSTITTTTATPNLALTKTASPSPITGGATLTYTLAYTNSGTGAAPSATLNETVPANTTFTTTGSSAGWSCANGSPAGTACSIATGSIPAGGSGSKTFAVVVVSPIPGGVTSIGNTACSLTPGDADGSNDCSTVGTPTSSPNLALTKTASPSPITSGATLTYTLAYTNSGTAASASATLNETVPANTTFTTAGSSPGWSCANGSPAGTACSLSIGSVAAGASGSKTFAVVVASPIPAGVTSIGNTACSIASGDGDTTNDCSTVITPATGSPDMVVTKTANPSPVAPGQALVYTINYQNNGDAAANSVVLTETVPSNTSYTTTGSSAGWSCANGSPAGTTCTMNLGTLAGAASGSKTFAVVVANPLPSGVSTIGNTACAHPTPPSADANAANDCGSVSTPSSGAPDLSLTKHGNQNFAVLGSVYAYTLVAANNGDQDAVGVVMQETVPQYTTFNAAGSSAGWSCADGAIAGTACQLTIGNLIAGGIDTKLFAVNIPAALPPGVSQVANAACVQATPPTDANPADNCTSVSNPSGAPDVHITKTANPTPVSAGSDLTYTLVIANLGNAAATSVVVNETVPANTTFLPGSSSAGWSCTPDNNAGAACANGIGTLAGGATVNLTFVVHVANPLPGGVTTIGNTACVDSTFDPNPSSGPGVRARTHAQGAVTSETCSTVTPPVGSAVNLAITKDDHGVSAHAGDTVVYFLDYSNIGNRSASGVVLTETVPTHSTFNASASTAGWSCAPDGNAGSSCTLAVGALTTGQTGQALFALTVETPTTATAILNTASIADDGAQGPDADTSNNTASDSTPILAIAAPHDIPTLGGLGLLLLAAGIAALAFARLRAH